LGIVILLFLSNSMGRHIRVKGYVEAANCIIVVAGAAMVVVVVVVVTSRLTNDNTIFTPAILILFSSLTHTVCRYLYDQSA
jgi:hypothetical protein